MRFRNWLIHKENSTFLEEASFGSANTEKAAKLFASLLSKKVGTLYPYGGYENYSESYIKSNGNKGVGYRFITDDGKAYRIDFDTTANGQVSGLTIWNNLGSEDPSTYIDIPSNLNSVEAAELIVTSAMAQGSGVLLQNLVESEVFEAAAKPNLAGLDPSLLTASGNLKRGAYDMWKKYGVDLKGKTWADLQKIANSVKVTSAGHEKTSRDAEVAKADADLAKKKYADADTIFEDLKDLVKMVVTGAQPSLLVTGMAGVGKTYTITETIKKYLGPVGGKWDIFKGKATTLGLYQALFVNRDKLVVFDDCDSIFSNADAVNLLKAALDSYDERTISWISKLTQDVSQFNAEELAEYYEKCMEAIKAGDPKVKLPSKFEFTGKIIFISNIEASKMDSAIKSRSFVIDITLERSALLKRIESLLPSIDPSTDLSIKREAFEALKAFSGNQAITMRSVIKAIRIRQAGSSRWKELIKSYV